jgi:hypothetical protein
LVVSLSCDDRTLQTTNPSFSIEVVNAAVSHQDNSGLKHVACSLLESLVCQSYNKAAVLEPTVLAGIFFMIKDSSEAVSVRACHTLGSLLVKYPEAAAVALTCTDSVAASLIASMEAHQRNSEIMSRLCSVVSALVANTDCSHHQVFANSGGLKAIVDCLSTLPQEIAMPKEVVMIQALTATIQAADDFILWAHRHAISHILIQALESLITDKGAAMHIVVALWGLCVRDEFFRRVTAAAVPALHKLMTINFSDSELQLRVARLVLMAAAADSSLTLSNESLGPLVQFLVNLMLAHCETSHLVITILDILCLLGPELSRQQELDEFECVAAILSIVQSSEGQPKIIGQAFAALSSVIADVEARDIIPLRTAILESLIRAMAQHTNEEHVQSNGLLLFKRYIHETESLKMMRFRKDELIPLLYSACNCSSTCVTRAEYIIRELG